MSKAEIFSVESRDGFDFKVTVYGRESAKGAVIVSHGFGEHSGGYVEFAQWLTGAGYACVAFDQRGHGEFPGVPEMHRKRYQGVIPGYESFLEDMDAVVSLVQKEMPDTPRALYGHSMGGNIALNYLLRVNQDGFICAVLEAPWLGLYKSPCRIVVSAAKYFRRICPDFTINHELALTKITSDKQKVEEIQDHLFHSRISVRMFSEINDACAYALEHIGRLGIPVHLAYAAEEKIVSNTAIEKVAAKEKADKKEAGKDDPKIILKEYQSLHSIHNDVNRNAFYRGMIQFLDEHFASDSEQAD